MKSKFYVISWKSLSRNTVEVYDFDDKQKAQEFADSLKAERKSVMICERVEGNQARTSYRMSDYGDFPFHKWMNVNIGVIILLGLLGIGYLIAKNQHFITIK